MALSLKNITILLVDDLPSMRELMLSMLAPLEPGKILTAGDGQKAVDIFYRQAPDIVITDWNMSPVDGIHLTRLIRTDPLSPNKKTPVIIATAFNDKKHLSIARDAGVTEYLVKPFSTNDLSLRLDSVMNNPRPFIEMPAFFGPDRRRSTTPRYKGPYRRVADWKNQRANTPQAEQAAMEVAFAEPKPCSSCCTPSFKSVDLSALRVLLVEDNPGVCLILKTMLLNIGITQVLIAHDGKQALQFLDSAPEMIDIIVCDWEMPHVTGIELLRQVRTVYSNMPFALLTGRSDAESVITAKENGVDAFITKPASLNDLRTNIIKALQRHHK